jgi:hypothetical protein
VLPAYEKFHTTVSCDASIAVGSRCTVAQLKTNVDEHDCCDCPSYITVFSVEHNTTNKSTARSRKHREKKKALSPMTGLKVSGKFQSVEFPPSPCSIDFEHTIIKDACRRMNPINFEEVGCAVCGELRH